MKFLSSLLLASLACMPSSPPDEIQTVRVEDIAFAVVLDQTMFNVDLPVSGIFTGTPFVALGVAHSNASITIYDLNGMVGYTAVYPPLAYDLHYAGATVFKTCYLNRASTSRWVETNCGGMTLDVCASKHIKAVDAMQKIDPPHATNPTCP